MNMKLQALAYGIFLLSPLCNTAQSKLGPLPEFEIEPEFYASQPLLRSQNISNAGHSTKITLIIEETTPPSIKNEFDTEFDAEVDTDDTDLTVHNIHTQSIENNLDIQIEDHQRIMTLSLFAAYKQCQKLSAMIDDLFNPLETFVAATFDQVEQVVGTNKVSGEESEWLIESVVTNLIDTASMRSISAETICDEYTSCGIEEVFCSNAPLSFNVFLATATGKSMMEIFNLYHLVLYELANQQAIDSDSLNLSNLASLFQALEAQFIAAIEAKLPEIEQDGVTTIQQVRAACFEALAAGREFLHAKRRELWAETLTIASAIATNVDRSVDDLVLVDFINEADQIIITV